MLRAALGLAFLLATSMHQFTTRVNESNPPTSDHTYSAALSASEPITTSAPPPPSRLRSWRAPCVDVLFVGARGSGQTSTDEHEMGQQVSSALAAYSSRVSGRRIAYWPVNYESHDVGVLVNVAVAALGGVKKYFKGMDQGVNDAIDVLARRSKMCPLERYVLAGYSQGAMVIHRVVTELDDKTRVGYPRVDGILLIADGDRLSKPSEHRRGSAPGDARGLTWRFVGVSQLITDHDATIRQLGPRWAERTYSVCDRGDIVCDANHVFSGATWMLKIVAGVRIHTKHYLGSDAVVSSARAIARETMAHPPSVPMTILPDELPHAVVGIPYSVTFEGSGGVSDYKFEAFGTSQLPFGFTLSEDGLLTGLPTVEGTVSFSIKVTDARKQMVHRTFDLIAEQPTVHPPTFLRITNGDGHSGRRNITESSSPEAPSVSSNGRMVAYASDASNLVMNDTNGCTDIFLYDAISGATTRITDGDDTSWLPRVSGDGLFVTFSSRASNLVPGDDNGREDVFLYNVQTQTTIRVTAAMGDSRLSTISDDGRYVAYQLELPDRYWDIYVFDALNGSSWRVTKGNDGGSWTPALSGDGRFIAFSSEASNLVPDDTNGAHDVFVYRMSDHVTERITRGNSAFDGSWNPSMSEDGRYVSYSSDASDLVAGDTNGVTDVFVYDANSQTTRRITDGNLMSRYSTMSDDGRYVVFYSKASNLVADDANSVSDVFLFDASTAQTTRLPSGSNASWSPEISGDGNWVTYTSDADDLVVGDINGFADVFVWERSN